MKHLYLNLSNEQLDLKLARARDFLKYLLNRLAVLSNLSPDRRILHSGNDAGTGTW
jgi:hypothetical protein